MTNPIKRYKRCKKTEYNRHILNSNNVVRTSWKLINKELGKDRKNHGIQSVSINGRSTSNHQIIADAFNKQFTTIPNMINQNISANYCLTNISVNNQNKLFSILWNMHNKIRSPALNVTVLPLKLPLPFLLNYVLRHNVLGKLITLFRNF